jgi:alkanesulfonate monooxygenase SsuD/methylene tetrahydromethanopterin reductase-like flavin-dependent oxidoreductase (luciferase family)
MRKLRRGIAVPCFGDDPAGLIELGVATEQAGFDGYFVWDHMLWSNTGEGPPILDPWVVLSVVAARTSRIKIGTIVTPVPRRRPWQLARETTTLDRLSDGRLILGVGIGAPSYGDFGLFGDAADERTRGEQLDEGLEVLAGLWGGERFSYAGEHFRIDPVKFAPTPVQRPRIPVWVAGVLPNRRPMARAARWDGFVPIASGSSALIRPAAEDIGKAAGQIEAARGSLDGYDVVVWAEVANSPSEVAAQVDSYAEAGATWWIETAWPRGDWWPGIKDRVAAGP